MVQVGGAWTRLLFPSRARIKGKFRTGSRRNKEFDDDVEARIDDVIVCERSSITWNEFK